jgi:hypothetical protein
MMGMNWHNYEHDWQRRRKNSDEKRLWRDVRLTKDSDGTFHLDHIPRVWEQDANGKWAPTRKHAHPLAKITSDNVLTLLYERTPDITVSNRLSTILNRAVWSNTTNHRNKTHKVRIRTVVWNREGQGYIPDPWHPTGVAPSNWAHGTIPYKAGLVFQLDSMTGDPIALLTPVEDTSILVKNSAVQKAKADTKVLRTLVRSMARMGVYDEHIDKKFNGSYWSSLRNAKIEEVNYQQPLGDDAEKVFVYGLFKANRPDTHYYRQGSWVPRPADEIRQNLIDNAIDNGMRALRQHIYSTTDGYETVVKQR